MPGTTLRALLTGCVRGAALACSEFLSQLQPLFKQIAGRIAQQYSAVHEVDDIVQEIHLKISSQMPRLAESLPGEDAMVRPYLACVAANAARDYFRRSKRERAAIPLEDGVSQLEERGGFRANLERQLLFDQIEAAIAPEERHRTLFRLYYRQGFSAAEIAAIPAIGLTVKGVESALSRMTAKIREHLKGNGGLERINRRERAAGN